MMGKGRLALLMAAAVLLFTTSCYAAKLEIGGAAPDWSGIIGVDDKSHSLSEYKDAKFIVLVFTCNHCPYATAYEDRLIALQAEFEDKGVQLIAVNVNNIPADRLDKMKIRAQQKGFNFPYLYDPTQQIAHNYGATVTPHIFLLDENQKIVYMGALDSSSWVASEKKLSPAETRYVRDALNALLEGTTPPETVTQQWGCTIKYEKKK